MTKTQRVYPLLNGGLLKCLFIKGETGDTLEAGIKQCLLDLIWLQWSKQTDYQDSV